ncbi:hypothetical protein EDD11_008669 [Mortierella claussenii]|nr:hypothetical protein EDD11_008669 [Mortierella claussenii]
MMRTTTSGRAFTKDMFDLFSTLMISIPIDSNKIRSRNYPNSFWAEKAITSLGGLQFVKSNREADPNDPTRIITHVVTTHFSLTRQMAKNLCQTFMEACLFESVTDPTKREFPNKGLCQITPKGAHLLAKFAYRNKLPLEESQHIKTHATAHLVYLERADDEDALILSKDHVDIIFQRFAGPEPNVSKTDSTSDSSLNLSAASSGNRDRAPLGTDHSNGIHVKDHQHRNGAYKDAFSGVAAVEWLLNYTTVISKEEAGRICQEMVNAQYISQAGEEPSAGPSLFRNNNGVLYHLTDEGRAKAGWKSLEEIDSIKNDWMDERSTIGTKTEGSQPEVSPLSTQFQLTVSNVARLPISILRPQRKSMDESSLASFQYHDAASSRNGASGSSSARRLSQILNDPAFQITLSESSGPASAYAPSSSGRESVGASAGGSMRLSPTMSASQSTTSNTSRLNGILSDTAVRDLFKSFLKQNFCEENLSFYLKVLEYKSKFSTLINTSRAYNQVNSGQEQSIYHPQQSHPHPPSLRELEKQICTQAFAIYETFLASGAPREVNLPHQMRQDITAYMQAVVRNMELADTREGRAKDHAPSSSPSSPSSSSHSSAIGSATDINESGADRASNESELIHIALFDGIHEHIFRLMSTDSVPKFIKTDKYLEVVMKKHKQRKNTVATNGVASMSDDPKAKTAGEAAAVGAGSGLDADGRVDLTGDMGGLNGEDREGGSVSTSGSNRNEGESQAEDDF